MRIAIEQLGDSGVWYHRQYIPHKGMDVVWFRPGEPVPRGCDIVVKSSNTRPLSLPVGYNPKVVVDVDDYWSPPKHHLLYGSSRVNDWKAIKRANFDNADLITCSTIDLANDVQKLIGYEHPAKLAIMPNCIDTDEPQFQINRQKQSVFTFGYVGGSTHLHDIREIRHALIKLRADRPGEFQFVYAGYDTRVEIRDAKGKLIPNAVNPHDEICDILKPEHVVNARPVQDYAQVYNFLDCAIAPLERHRFNQCKSPLKFIEAAAFGVPVIASFIDPFICINNIVTCITTIDWYNAMNAAIDEDITEMGNAALHEANSRFNYKQQREVRAQIYRELIG
jgi:glycosyltransferase involved in cell wall biosynthesis